MFGKLIDYFRGTTRLSLAGFFVAGHALAWFGKLGPSYIAFMTAFLTAGVMHSAKEDYFKTKPDTTSTTTTVATPSAIATQTTVTEPKDTYHGPG